MNIKNASDLTAKIFGAIDKDDVPFIITDEPQLVYGLLNAMKLSFLSKGINFKFNEKPTISQAISLASLALGCEDDTLYAVVIHKKHYVGELPNPFDRIVVDKIYLSVGSVIKEIASSYSEVNK